MISICQPIFKSVFVFCAFFCFMGLLYFSGNHSSASGKTLILALDQYDDANVMGLWNILFNRIQKQPFNLGALFLFVGAIVHTFFAHFFRSFSTRLKERNIRSKYVSLHSFAVEALDLLGKVEIIFGLWLIPLLLLFVFFYDWNTAFDYLKGIDYLEAVFVAIVMCVTSSGPILSGAEKFFGYLTKFGKNTASAWWWAILTFGPLLGSLITEPGAMTISAFLLCQKFYPNEPGRLLAYGTFGLLFANISVAGALSDFIDSPMSTSVDFWVWDTYHLFWHFGWKSFISVIFSNTIYYIIFRKEFVEIDALRLKKSSRFTKELVVQPSPYWITITYALFLMWIVIYNDNFWVVVVLFFLFFVFYKTTSVCQKKIELKHFVLVGFFLASLIVHGDLQGWWLQPILNALFFNSVVSGFFNHLETIVFFRAFFPDFHELMKFAVVVSAVTESEISAISSLRNSSGNSAFVNYFEEGSSSLFLVISVFISIFVSVITFYFVSVVF